MLVGTTPDARGTFSRTLTCAAAFLIVAGAAIMFTPDAHARQKASISGNASATSNITIIGTSGNRNTVNQSAGGGQAVQKSENNGEARTDIDVDARNNAANDYLINQDSRGNGLFSENQDAEIDGNATARSDATVDGDAQNRNDVEQECTRRQRRRGQCRQTSENEGDADTLIDGSIRNDATNLKTIRQRARRSRLPRL